MRRTSIPSYLPRVAPGASIDSTLFSLSSNKQVLNTDRSKAIPLQAQEPLALVATKATVS